MLYSLTVTSKPFCAKPWEISRLGVSGSFKMGLKIELVGSLYEETDPQTPSLSYSGQASAPVLPGGYHWFIHWRHYPVEDEISINAREFSESSWTDRRGYADPFPTQLLCAGSKVLHSPGRDWGLLCRSSDWLERRKFNTDIWRSSHETAGSPTDQSCPQSWDSLTSF